MAFLHFMTAFVKSCSLLPTIAIWLTIWFVSNEVLIEGRNQHEHFKQTEERSQIKKEKKASGDRYDRMKSSNIVVRNKVNVACWWQV